MTKEIEAFYEQGMIRPLQPSELPEGARLDLIVITHGLASKIRPRCWKQSVPPAVAGGCAAMRRIKANAPTRYRRWY